MKRYLGYLTISFVAFQSCNVHKESDQLNSMYSVEDSLAAYQDSLVQAWNIMISDDNQKINAMQTLLHELESTSIDDRDKLERFGQQLEQLGRLRYTQKSMSNADVIEEYDFASGTLVMELISLAESRIEYNKNMLLQKLVDDILLADDRVNNYREEYDGVVADYNDFIDNNKPYLKEMNADSLRKRSLFQMVSVE
ncbi:MAG: hypothetical protein ABIS36_12760 [Chryseolinea sp.]